MCQPGINKGSIALLPWDGAAWGAEQVLVQQFTDLGAPHIWNGDEVGMWGADDPDERKPMVWAEFASLFAWAFVMSGLLPVAPLT